MFHKIKSVAAAPDFTLTIQFSEGVTKRYDARPLLDQIPAFHLFLTNPEEFSCVQVDTGGYGIIWNDDVDLSCDELWEHGKTISTPFDGLMAFSDASTLWGLNESTLRKAVSYGKLQNGIDVCKFGKQWIISYAAMEREYGEPKNS